MKVGNYEHLVLVTSLIVSIARGKEPDLPPCPTNINFLPQNLPMHCRMTNQPNPQQMMQQVASIARMGPPPNQPGYNNPAGKMPPPIPFAMPGPMPAGMPMPMPMPLPSGDPSHKLPVIVMPFYSQDPSYSNNRGTLTQEHKKKKKKKKSKKKKARDGSFDNSSGGASEHSDGSDEDRSEDFRRLAEHTKRASRKSKVKKKNNKQGLLTPILQYVTRDGYVIYEKELSKNEADEWEDAGPGSAKNPMRARPLPLVPTPPPLPPSPPPPPPPPPTAAPVQNELIEPDEQKEEPDSKQDEVQGEKYILPKKFNQITKVAKTKPVKIRKRVSKRRNRFKKTENPDKEQLAEDLRDAQQES